jgi:hypothetical protein
VDGIDSEAAMFINTMKNGEFTRMPMKACWQ